jgi:TetR/AcrR family transcriptional regulator, regulator of autoinduction and epiphytic fitness
VEKAMKLKDKKRLAIMQAAATEFQAKGYPDTSMDRIAEQANVSKRTVYNHFPSKEELFKAVVFELLEKVHSATDFPYQPNAPLHDQLTTIADREFDLIESPGFLDMMRSLVSEVIRSPDLAAKLHEGMQKNELGIVIWIRAAAQDGRLDIQDPIMAGEQFFALIKAFAFWPRIVGYGDSPTLEERKKIVESTVTMFLGHYAVKG